MAKDRQLPSSVPVWDAAVRVFHWSLVSLVAASWISGGSGERLHETVGWAVAGLIAFRIVWGFLGTRHARFLDFVSGPSSMLAYLSGIAKRQPRHYVGHNPAGAAMILLLVATLLTIIVSGAMMQTHRFFGVEWVEKVHSVAADALLVLVPLHVLGALLSSWLHHENLILAMFSGHKTLPPGQAVASHIEQAGFRRRGAAGLLILVILAICGAVYGWISTSSRAAADVPNTIGGEVQAPHTMAQAVEQTAQAAELRPTGQRVAGEPRERDSPLKGPT